jgi:hypothetical protein
MTGVELYIRKKNGDFVCYKQRHDGYFIEDYLLDKEDKVFNMTADEIIKDFHDSYFLEYVNIGDNYKDGGSKYEYGVKIPKEAVNNTIFMIDDRNGIYSDIDKYIWDNYNSETDENDEYAVGYGDYVVYIDLIENRIEGLDSIDNQDDENWDLGDDPYLDD